MQEITTIEMEFLRRVQKETNGQAIGVVMAGISTDDRAAFKSLERMGFLRGQSQTTGLSVELTKEGRAALRNGRPIARLTRFLVSQFSAVLSHFLAALVGAFVARLF